MNTRINSDQQLIDLLSSLKNDESVNPSVHYRENSKIRLMNLIADEKTVENKSSFVFIRNPKFAFRLAGAFLIILIFISSGTILAAQSSNPKNSLYPVKLASEEIALKISPSPFKADIAVEIAKRRGNEINSNRKNLENSEIKIQIQKYKQSINQAKYFTPLENKHINEEIKNEEGNLKSLEKDYEDQKEDENSKEDTKVKGVSDFNFKQSDTNTEQKTIEQKNQETPKPTEVNSSQNLEKTVEETRMHLENEFQKVISPQTSEEHR